MARQHVAKPRREGAPDNDPHAVLSGQGIEPEEAGHPFGIVSHRGDRRTAFDGLSTHVDRSQARDRDRHRVHTRGDRPEGNGFDPQRRRDLRGTLRATSGHEQAIQTGCFRELTSSPNADRADAGEQDGGHRKSGPSS